MPNSAMDETVGVRFDDIGPSLSEDDIRHFERRNHVHLPAAYRSFMLRQNGGSPAGNATPDYLDPVSGERRTALLTCLYSIDPRSGSLPQGCLSLTGEWAMMEGRIPPHTLPVGGCLSGNLVLLSCEGGDQGKVHEWDCEREVNIDQAEYWMDAAGLECIPPRTEFRTVCERLQLPFAFDDDGFLLSDPPSASPRRTSKHPLYASVMCLNTRYVAPDFLAFVSGLTIDPMFLPTDIERILRAGDVEGLRRLLDGGHDINTWKKGSSLTLLHMAIGESTVDMVKMLVERGAETRGALHWAAQRKDAPELLQYLLTLPLDLNERDTHGRTPLRLAEGRNTGSPELARLLRERRAISEWTAESVAYKGDW